MKAGLDYLSVVGAALWLAGCGPPPPEGYPTLWAGVGTLSYIWSDGAAGSEDREDYRGRLYRNEIGEPYQLVLSGLEFLDCGPLEFEETGPIVHGLVDLYMPMVHECRWTLDGGGWVSVTFENGWARWESDALSYGVSGPVQWRMADSSVRDGTLSVTFHGSDPL